MSATQEKSRPLPSGFRGVLADSERWLALAQKRFPEAAGDAAALAAAIEPLRVQGARVEAPLFCVLCGGTGAGKSTLLNALAGESIAVAGAIRPTTTELTIYVHELDELDVPPELRRLGRICRHARPELRHKVLVDAPDFDSTALGHRERLIQALSASDFAVVLATPEKYANGALYEVLTEFRDQLAFVFVMNRLDLGIEPELIADFEQELGRAGFERPRILKLSARDALADKLGRAAPKGGRPGDFAALETIVERELDRVRIREIKRKNLDGRVAHLGAGMRCVIPAELGARCERVVEGARELGREAGERIGERLGAAVLEDAGLRSDLEAQAATSVAGPMGVWQTLVWAIRGLRGRGLSALTPDLMAQSTSGGALGALAGWLRDPDQDAAREVGLAARRADDLTRELGMAPCEEPLDEKPAREIAGAARRAAAREVEAALRSAREPARGLRARLWSWVLNLPGFVILGFAAYRWLAAYFAGATLPPGWFAFNLIVLVGVLWLAGKLIDFAARRRAGRTLVAAAQAASRQAARAVEHPLVERATLTTRAALELSDQLGELDARRAAVARASSAS
ncbi:MAG: GTPase domain-containing protein [Planctomycetota bacterium]|jgi:energy-coupling factor transporter ATP-binding protein EcfA2